MTDSRSRCCPMRLTGPDYQILYVWKGRWWTEHRAARWHCIVYGGTGARGGRALGAEGPLESCTLTKVRRPMLYDDRRRGHGLDG